MQESWKNKAMILVPENLTTYITRLGDLDGKGASADIMIGGDDPLKFIPNVNFSKWEGEFFVNLNSSDDTVLSEHVSEQDGVVSIDLPDRIHEFSAPGSDKLIWDIILKTIPLKDNISLSVVQSTGLDWLYQPEISDKEARDYINRNRGNEFEVKTLEEAKRAIRSRNVVGSYAIYCNKANNKYKTGKVAHIFLPELIDADGNRQWADDLVYDGSQLLIMLPMAWLLTAVFPVRVDPDLGYTSVGGSSDNSGVGLTHICNTPAAGSAGTIDTISYYAQFATEPTQELINCVYDDDSGPDALIDYTAAGNTTGTPGWYMANAANGAAITNGLVYYIGAIRESNSKYYYDSDASYTRYNSNTTYPTLSNPFSSDSSNGSQRMTAYLSYTEAGGLSIPIAMHHYTKNIGT